MFSHGPARRCIGARPGRPRRHRCSSIRSSSIRQTSSHFRPSSVSAASTSHSSLEQAVCHGHRRMMQAPVECCKGSRREDAKALGVYLAGVLKSLEGSDSRRFAICAVCSLWSAGWSIVFSAMWHLWSAVAALPRFLDQRVRRCVEWRPLGHQRV